MKSWLGENLAQATLIILAWYLSEPRPNPVPAFWFHVERCGWSMARFAHGRYVRSIEGYLK